MLSAILLALGAVTLAVVVVACLKWEKLIDWIRGYRKLVEADKDNIAFSIQEKLKDGKYSVVHGVFNKNTNTILEGTKVEADKLDPEVLEAHKEGLVLYN